MDGMLNELNRSFNDWYDLEAAYFNWRVGDTVTIDGSAGHFLYGFVIRVSVSTNIEYRNVRINHSRPTTSLEIEIATPRGLEVRDALRNRMVPSRIVLCEDIMTERWI